MIVNITCNLPHEFAPDFTDDDVRLAVENCIKNFVKISRIGKRHRLERETALAQGKTMPEAIAIADSTVAPIRATIEGVVSVVNGNVAVERS